MEFKKMESSPVQEEEEEEDLIEINELKFSNWLIVITSFEMTDTTPPTEPFHIYTLEISVAVKTPGTIQPLSWSKKVRYRDCLTLHKKLQSRIAYLGFRSDMLPEYPPPVLKTFFTESFLRERLYGLQEYFKKLPQKLFETPELSSFLEIQNELGLRGFSTTDFERLVKLSSTIYLTRSRQETKVSYDKMSTLALYDSLKEIKENIIREKSIEGLKVKEGERVLEIGFGTGHAIVNFAMLVGQSGLICGLEISEGMLNKTQNRLFKEGLNNWFNIKLGLGDATQGLPYEDASFDIIYMSFTLELFSVPEMNGLLKECYRVLGKGGRICVVALAKSDDETLAVKIYEWLYQKLPFFLDCRPIFVNAVLGGAGFNVGVTEHVMAWAIPIDIVIAEK